MFFVSSPADPTLRGGKIAFRGAECDMEYDIYLEPSPSASKSHNYSSYVLNVITVDPKYLVCYTFSNTVMFGN